MISVFYDGKCGMCRKEITHYKRIAPENVFNWIDITVDASKTKKYK
jgi:predicted DCC family thiol-disulfide oxidoreductase YuxK